MTIVNKIFCVWFCFCLLSCSNKLDDEFYGKYVCNDTSSIFYSEITFYPDDIYSYHSASCFDYKSDSGTFAVDADTIRFNSIYKAKYEKLKKDTTRLYTFRFVPLAARKIIFTKDKLCCYLNKNPLGRGIHDSVIYNKTKPK